MPKTTAEKIATKDEQIQQLLNEKKRLIQKQKSDERKARTKRLIERGAILESLIADSETYTNEQLQIALKETIGSDYGRKALHRAKQPHKGNAATEKAETAPQDSVTAPVGGDDCTEGTG